jgi:hypothetical protein
MTSIVNEELQPKYAILMETNGEECESWYYFIKHDGNEKSLEHLKKQLEQIEMYIIDDMSTFDIDLDHLISAETAKQMTKVELNSVSFHRKFDGELKTVNLGLKRKDSNEKRIMKAHDKLGFGNIDEFIDKEDLDLEDCVSESEESEHEDDEDLVPLPLTETLEVKEEKENGIETVLISNDSMGAVGVQQLVKKKKKKKTRQ